MQQSEKESTPILSHYLHLSSGSYNRSGASLGRGNSTSTERSWEFAKLVSDTGCLVHLPERTAKYKDGLEKIRITM